jgi:hypothetical protein
MIIVICFDTETIIKNTCESQLSTYQAKSQQLYIVQKIKAKATLS